MLSEDDIRNIIKLKAETQNIDFKEHFFWDKEHKDQKLEIIKDILAMANTKDGGTILFGIEDDNFDFVGLPDDQFRNIDPTRINDFIHIYCDPQLSCIVHKQTIDDKKIGVIEVPEFESEPIICKRDAHSSLDSSKQILRSGQLYIRTGKATSEIIPSSVEMRNLLGRALRKKSDELLHSIEILLSGKASKPSEKSLDSYNSEATSARKYLRENLGDSISDFGYWEVTAFPKKYLEKRVSNHNSITTLLQKSQVNLRGWNAPHMDTKDSSNFSLGCQSSTIWEFYIEGYRAYFSGYLHILKAFKEDAANMNRDGQQVLSFIGAIYSITEYLLFFKRFYEQLLHDESVHITVSLHGVKNRLLIATDPLVHLSGGYIDHNETIIVTRSTTLPELESSYKEIANSIIREVFANFNWNNVSEEIISGMQDNLFKILR